MTFTKIKYFAKVQVINGSGDDYFWLGFVEAKTLAAVRHYCNTNGCMNEISIQEGIGFKVISKKNAKGKWEDIQSSKSDNIDPYANDQTQYFLHGNVSKEYFYKYRFKHPQN